MAATDLRLTYCGNVHAANDVDGWLAATRRYTVPVARRMTDDGHAFGLGVWWNATVAHHLATDAALRARVAEFLASERLEPWTLNVFPYGDFHDERVKAAVYRPDWAESSRADYTLDAARAVAALVPEGAVVPISTLPLGHAHGDLERMARALASVGRELATLAATTGRSVVLALEPEPCCLCETTAQVADFLESRVFGPAGVREEAVLRRHLGVCVDLCHLAVVGEDPLAALRSLGARGVAVPKIQVSSCLELRDPAAHLDDLLAFDEPRYLHQTFGNHGLRALDLDEVKERRAEFAAADRLRTHFHLPVFWDAPGPLGSTRAELERILPALELPLPLLEVETYTWSVLGAGWGQDGDRSLVEGLLRELRFVRGLVAS